MEFLEFLRGRGLGGGSPSPQVSHSFSPPTTCIEGTVRVPFLWLGVCTDSGTLGSGQDGGERQLGAGVSSGPVFFIFL